MGDKVKDTLEDGGIDQAVIADALSKFEALVRAFFHARR